MALRPALFLDRDGVVNIDSGYVHRIEDFRFDPAIFELCRAAHARGYAIVIITNQSGIARGFYGVEDYRRLTGWMLARFRAECVEIAAVYHCPFHPTEGLGPYRRAHSWRKPEPGMILDAARTLHLRLGASILIGDQERDIDAARAAGVGTAILVHAGHDTSRADHVFDTMAEALDWFVRTDDR